MRRAAAVLAALALHGCASPPAPTAAAPAVAVPAAALSGPRELALRNPGFELDPAEGGQVPGWGCTAHSDPDSFRCVVDSTVAAEGQRSLRIERLRSEPWGLSTQTLPARALAGQRVRYSLSVRTQDAVGAGAGAYLLFQGGAGVTLVHQQKLERGTTGWTRQVIELEVPPGTEAVVAGAILEGSGKVWIDAARLEVVAAEAKR